MKRFLTGLCLVAGISAMALASPPVVPVILLGINANTGGYPGVSTFTLVDQNNSTSSLVVNNLSVTGNVLSNVTVIGNVSDTNQSVAGVLTNSGTTVYPPTTQVTVSTQVPIAPTGTVMQIESTGSVVMFGITSLYPAISTATATNGQYLVLFATTTTSIVNIATGTATGVVGANQFIVLDSTMSAVQFIFSSALQQWVEVGKQ